MADPAGDAILRQLAAVVTTLERASPPDWSAPTRCRPWDVRALAAHIAIPAAALANGLAALPSGAERSRDSQPLADDVQHDGVLDALRERTATLQQQLSMLTSDELDVPLPPVTDGDLSLPTRTLLRLALVEIGIHRHDLDGALGGAGPLDDDVVDAVSAIVPAWLVFGSTGAPRPTSPVAYELSGDRLRTRFAYEPDSGWQVTDGGRQPSDAGGSCRIEGSDSDLALFMLGRPTSGVSVLIVSGESAAVDRFKTYLPGP